MHEYRQALMRLRQGDSVRLPLGLMGRAKAARFRELARAGLGFNPPLPPDAEIAGRAGPAAGAADRPVDACRVSPPGRAAGSARASPAWPSTPRWCASMASRATIPASAA